MLPFVLTFLRHQRIVHIQMRTCQFGERGRGTDICNHARAHSTLGSIPISLYDGAIGGGYNGPGRTRCHGSSFGSSVQFGEGILTRLPEAHPATCTPSPALISLPHPNK